MRGGSISSSKNRGVVKKPIFIVGSGRSGTSVFFRILASHQDLGYFTNLDCLYPRLFKYGVLSLIENKKVVRSLINRLIFIFPDEEIIGINEFCGIQKMGIPLSEEEARLNEAKCLKQMIQRCLRYSKKERFIAKNTTNGMRIKYLNKIFPDSIFIHVIRDGRANVNSYLNVSFFSEINFWWNKNKNLADWIKKGKSPTRLAALHWKNNVEEILVQSKILPRDRYYEIKYEDYTRDPEFFFKKIIEFCGLKWNNYFKLMLKGSKLENRDFKWKKNLTDIQKNIIETEIYDLLKKLKFF